MSDTKPTPAAEWREKGEPDPHGTIYDCPREQLTLGQYSDDSLANGVFLNYDRPLDLAAIIKKSEGYHPSIVWMTAAKERIRWLSRQLVKAQARIQELEADIADTFDNEGPEAEDAEPIDLDKLPPTVRKVYEGLLFSDADLAPMDPLSFVSLRTIASDEIAPGHTDLMVSPESIEAFCETNPPPTLTPLHQIKLHSDESSAWHDATESAYDTHPEGARRIVYVASKEGDET